MNRAEPSVNVQVRLKYQDYLKNPVELGPGMHHRSARPHQAADTSAPGQPARTRTLGTIRLRGGRGGSLGPRGHAAGVMAGRCGSARHVGGRAAPVAPLVLAADGERPKDSRRARSRQRSSPASSSNRGADNNHFFQRADKELEHRRHCYATAKLLRDDEAESMDRTSILNRFASLLAGG